MPYISLKEHINSEDQCCGVPSIIKTACVLHCWMVTVAMKCLKATRC